MTYHSCPHCGAQLTHPDEKCWNCTPAVAIAEINVPVITNYIEPEEKRKRFQ
jgi:hypothetical protein